MASQDNRIKLECEKCGRVNYFSRKNKSKLADHKLELEKYCKWDKEHTVHKEA